MKDRKPRKCQRAPGWIGTWYLPNSFLTRFLFAGRSCVGPATLSYHVCFNVSHGGGRASSVSAPYEATYRHEHMHKTADE